MNVFQYVRAAMLVAMLATSIAARGDDGHDGWLRYARVANAQQYSQLPGEIAVLGASSADKTAARELQRGLSSMLGRTFTMATPDKLSDEDSRDVILITSIATLSRIATVEQNRPAISGEGYEIRMAREHGHTHLLILGGTPQAELFAVFHLLEEIASQKPIPANESQSPAAPIRWTDEWDNPNGTIERGYAGPSIFFENGHIRQDLTRAGEYARLLASIGINGCNINNVNADLQTLSTEHLHEFARVADVFRPWGVKLALSVDLTSPQVVGGLDTFDPLDPKVIAWWKQKIDEIYALIPDFAGFTVKADSEGRKGPSQYGRSPADAANVLARALAPHHGVVLYRGFVYNNHLDWNDLKADRARAGYDNFHALDGKFEPNVVIQIKHGPIDFQVREPVSPLFAALKHTNQAIELQTTQEYTGQQRHMVFLVPMWKTALDTDMRADNRRTPVKEIVEGRSFHQPLGGFVSVVNVGMDANWLHHPMAMANLYGFGKLAWNPELSSEQIIDSWTRLTFGKDPKVVSTVDKLQLESWNAYENYTGPLGLGTLTNILGVHYGPGIESAERNGWGQWLRADSKGIGMDRTVATGTGYIGQYPPELAAIYESLKTCPDELLLFMHHVPYDHVLHSGKTVVQHVYDSHYAGAATAATYAPAWMELKGLIDPDVYAQTLELFQYQAGHAVVWRDAVSVWFQKISGIADKLGRVGHYPDRIEAEAMQADGYVPVAGDPVETASGGQAVVCRRATPCSLITTLERPAGLYDIAVQYYDLRSGVSQYDLLLNDKPLAHWAADATLPPATMDRRLDGSTSTRYTLPAPVALKPGDVLTLRGTPGGDEPAPVDSLEITPYESPKP
jgi:alpha-glucuronidase